MARRSDLARPETVVRLLPTNRAKRDQLVAERLAAVGATFHSIDSYDRTSGPKQYNLYFTVGDDCGPRHTYSHGSEIPAFNAYCLSIMGVDDLDSITARPDELLKKIWRERHDFHWKRLNCDQLQSNYYRAEKDYGREAANAKIAEIRGKGDQWHTLAQIEERRAESEIKLRAAIEAYDAATAAIDAITGPHIPGA